MTLKEIFTLLATGEFSNMALSRNNTGGINESEYAKVIGHINLALVEIYKRFRLMENECTLSVTTTNPLYYLRNDRIIGADLGVTEYIEPSSGQTQLNIIEVTGVFDSTGAELVMNNRYTVPSITQPAFDILKFSGLTADLVCNVVYQTYPNKIILDDDFDPETYILPISDVVLEALLYYVASRIYKPTGANNSTAAADKSVSYEQKYELACQKLDLFGLGIQNCDEEDTFTSEGWV